MRGTVQIKKGRPNYYVVLDYTDATGRRKRPWISTDIPVAGNNKRAANARLKEVLVEYESQDIDLSKNILFVDFMKHWLDTLQLSIAESTYDGYRSILYTHIIPFFEPLKIKVRDITPMHIQQYVKHCMKSVSANTVHRHLANISKCLDNAVRQNIIAYNPVKRIDPPKKQKFTGAKIYNERQIGQLLECSKGDPLEIVILLTVFYGLRRSECLGIKWNAIDFENRVMAINHTVIPGRKKEYRTDATKNNSSNSVVPLSRIIISRLKQWKSQQTKHKLLQPNDYIDEGYVCTQIDGSLIKPHYVTQHFKILLAKNNMPHIRFHDLRHSSAGYLKYLGFDLKDIQVWLRHGDIGTTMNIYVNLDMDAKRSIADNLNRHFENFSR